MNKQVSIVIASGNDAQALESVAPMFLQQQYEVGYEVIISNESREEEVADVVKRLSARFPELIVTFVPSSAISINRHRMAITLGVKAAKYDCVIIPDSSCEPENEHWLSRIDSSIEEDMQNVVLLYMHEKYNSATKLANRCTIVNKDTFLQHGGLSHNAHFNANEFNIMIRNHFLRLYGEKRPMGMKILCWWKWMIHRLF